MIKDQTHKLVIQRLKDHAKAGRCLGFSKPQEVQKLAESLERDSSQWFAASIQLLQVGFITRKEYDDLAR